MSNAMSGAENLPLVTAVVPVYNHEKYVTQSIRSVIAQTYPNIELIVINDGSSDRSDEMVLTVVEECKKRFSRFEYINRANRGLSSTLNQALGMARGKYFSAHASDDMVLPDKFSWLVEALEASDDTVAAAFANASFIDERGQTFPLDGYSTFIDFYTKDRRFDCRTEFASYLSLLAGNYLPAMSNLLKTAMVREAGGWTPGNTIDDWEMWLKLSRQHKFIFIDKIVACYRMHGTNISLTMKPQILRDMLKVHAREKAYCVPNGLGVAWKHSLYGYLYWLMRFSGLPVRERLAALRYLRPSDALSLPLFVGLRVKQSLMAAFSGMRTPLPEKCPAAEPEIKPTKVA